MFTGTASTPKRPPAVCTNPGREPEPCKILFILGIRELVDTSVTATTKAKSRTYSKIACPFLVILKDLALFIRTPLIK
jgi:hypothetical protein